MYITNQVMSIVAEENQHYKEEIFYKEYDSAEEVYDKYDEYNFNYSKNNTPFKRCSIKILKEKRSNRIKKKTERKETTRLFYTFFSTQEEKQTYFS